MTSLYDYCKEHNKEYLLKEWNYELNKDIDIQVITTGSNKKVWWICPKCRGQWQATVCDRTREKSTGCPYCAGQKVLKGYNDLATKYPDLINQWHPTKNGNLNSTDVMSGSSKKAWWVCSKGHEFEQKINARVKHINSCPICSGQKVLTGQNDLASQYPNVANEWNYEKNGDITPKNITWGSNKKFWWKCSKCNYEWQARVSDRTRGNNGCPACTNKVLVVGFNDLETKYPDISKEWHPYKNGNLTPKDVKACEHKKYWWQCSNNHDFLQSISLRTTRMYGCPYCAGQKVLKGYNDLATNFPELAKEWHPTKNGDLTPKDVTSGSRQKVWWICPEGHEYAQPIEKRTSRDQSCPYCSGHKALKGLNDLTTKFPEIAKEWHPTKNGDLTPKDVTSGSRQKVWWICPIGHEYQATISSRKNGTNCPICASRNTTSFPEQAIFFYVKQIFPDAINKYNEIFDTSMELDIYIPTLKIAIEYDGAAWHNKEEHYKRELKKYNLCKTNKIYLIRVKEHINKKWENVADEIYYLPTIKRNNLNELEIIIVSLLKKLTSIDKIDVDLNRDKYEIFKYVYKIENSLAEKRPDVAEKWNYEKNGYLKPNMFKVNSHESVWWKCPTCGNEWENNISNMVRDNLGCNKCSNKQKGRTHTKNIVKKVGSLAETMPELAKEWHPTKNGDLTPQDITAGRFKPVWWLCSKCGYEWQASPNNRKKGVGCPCCSGRVPQIGVNDLATLYPQIASEWHPVKNGDLNPNMFKSGSEQKVWWLCPECGYEYKSRINQRTSKNKQSGCPACKRKKAVKIHSIQVNMFDVKTNQYIKTFDSIKTASREMHISYENIIKTCKGQREQAGGYKWRYTNNNFISISVQSY